MNTMNTDTPADTRYAWVRDVPLPFAAAVDKVTALLGEHGFGVLTRIDVHEVLRKKLGVERDPYVILGACNPTLANQALGAAPSIGILLPCNVVVEAIGDASRVWVTRPEGLFSLVDRADVAPIAAEVSARLEAVREGLA